MFCCYNRAQSKWDLETEGQMSQYLRIGSTFSTAFFPWNKKLTKIKTAATEVKKKKKKKEGKLVNKLSVQGTGGVHYAARPKPPSFSNTSATIAINSAIGLVPRAFTAKRLYVPHIQLQ